MSQVRTNQAITSYLSNRDKHKKVRQTHREQEGRVALREERHLLDRKRAACPIDGSPGVWRLP